VQPPNAVFPMDVTLLGIVTLTRLLQFWNAFAAMTATGWLLIACGMATVVVEPR
jgi:hypothetical protein